MTNSQPGILAPLPNHSRYIEFSVVADCDPVSCLKQLALRRVGSDLVIGLGSGLVQGMGKSVVGLHGFQAESGPGCEVPSTQADLWCWIRGDDRGQNALLGRELTRALKPAFKVERLVDGFKYETGLDLSGYEDGTENPEGDDAIDAAIAKGVGVGIDGSSFVSVQQWRHDLDHFDSLSEETCDNIIGRRISDNVEFDGSPASAHVKRTAQESFDPEAFMVRRSLPWGDASGEGLMFVAFGNSLDAFEAQLKRMTGQEDGIVDGLFRFTRPLSGSNFWCPPVADGHLDFSAVGI